MYLFVVRSSTSGKKKSFHSGTKRNTTTVAIAGLTSGTITVAKMRNSPAPSMRAASSNSCGQPAEERRQDEHRERDAARRVDEHQPQPRIDQTERAEQVEDRQDAQPDRQHQPGQEVRDQQAAAAEPVPAERVRRGQRDAHVEQRRRRPSPAQSCGRRSRTTPASRRSRSCAGSGEVGRPSGCASTCAIRPQRVEHHHDHRHERDRRVPPQQHRTRTGPLRLPERRAPLRAHPRRLQHRGSGEVLLSAVMQLRLTPTEEVIGQHRDAEDEHEQQHGQRRGLPDRVDTALLERDPVEDQPEQSVAPPGPVG